MDNPGNQQQEKEGKLMLVPIPAKIHMITLCEGEEPEDWGVIDLAEKTTYFQVFLCFGNGAVSEARVVGETKEGVFIFANMVERGGYWRSQALDIPNAKLYQEGDACYPDGDPFIFIAPNTADGDYIDFANYEEDFEAFIHSLESRTNIG